MQRSIAGGGTAGIERVRFLDRRPSAIATREKPLLQFEEFFFFEPSPVFLPLSSESVFLALYVFLQCSNDRAHLGALRFSAGQPPELQSCDETLFERSD